MLWERDSNEQQSDFIAGEIKTLLVKGVSAEEIAIIGRTRYTLELLKNTASMSEIPIVQTYRNKPSIAQKLLRLLTHITKWYVQNAGKSEFRAVKSLTNLLKAAGIPKKSCQQLVDQVINGGWNALHLPKKPSEKHYRTVLTIKNAVIKAASLSPEAGMQILIDAVKPIAIYKVGKKERLPINCELSSVKLAVRDCMTWNDVPVKNLLIEPNHSGVTMTTSHASKGKEWQYVFVINVIDGEYPFHFDKAKSDCNLKEELRIFYVTITRASQKLYLIQCPVHRIIFVNALRKKFIRSFDQESFFISEYKTYMKLIR